MKHHHTEIDEHNFEMHNIVLSSQSTPLMLVLGGPATKTPTVQRQ